MTGKMSLLTRPNVAVANTPASAWKRPVGSGLGRFARAIPPRSAVSFGSSDRWSGRAVVRRAVGADRAVAPGPDIEAGWPVARRAVRSAVVPDRVPPAHHQTAATVPASGPDGELTHQQKSHNY
ncbi:hypothetical protein GCM10022207_46750 [Streptomyces lannensis]|uniref:Uncharacterized protein n=1 Tax=Streptomyces lannensis TaxID=766498 RepID=A0ABP7KF52_9ACTN